jgi:hypothetical protein
VPQHIGNAGTRATAWVEHIILSPSPQVRRAKELEEFMERLKSLSDPGEPLDVTTRRLMETFFGYKLEKVRIHRGQGAEEASRRLGARAFTIRGHIFGPRQNLDNSTREGLGLLAHELTHVIQRVQPHRLPQRQVTNREDSPMSATLPGGHSDVEMVLLASPKSSPLTTNPQLREAQAQANEQLVVEGLADNTVKSPPQINPEEVANKVYRLLQYELVLERERATKIGG